MLTAMTCRRVMAMPADDDDVESVSCSQELQEAARAVRHVLKKHDCSTGFDSPDAAGHGVLADASVERCVLHRGSPHALSIAAHIFASRHTTLVHALISAGYTHPETPHTTLHLLTTHCAGSNRFPSRCVCKFATGISPQGGVAVGIGGGGAYTHASFMSGTCPYAAQQKVGKALG